jgi:hypothetical protein
LLRELRIEIQDIQAVLGRIRRGEASLSTYYHYFARKLEEIGELQGRIKDGESVRHIQNVWEQIAACPLLVEQVPPFPSEVQLRYLNELETQCRSIVLQIGIITIPSRLNEWLVKARPGYYIPFHSVFDDELPVYEDRVRVLNYLAWAPETVSGGIVDASTGLIYRYSSRVGAQLVSLVLAVAGFAAATALVVGASIVPLPGWPFGEADLPKLLTGWLAVLAGIVIHIAVSTAKRMQAQSGLPPVIAVGDTLLLIDAKVGEILLKLVLALFGFFGFVLASGVANVSLLSAFLVGYSLDSVVGLFSTSIEERAAAQVAALKQGLGGEVRP